jgi:hypothetical protein
MKKRGRRSTVEKHDASGMPIQIRHEVYINSIRLHLPASLGTLSSADLLTIQQNHGSPYTEDFNNVLAALDYDVVDASLRTLAIDALAPVSAMSVSRLRAPVIMCRPVLNGCALMPVVSHVALTAAAAPCTGCGWASREALS